MDYDLGGVASCYYPWLASGEQGHGMNRRQFLTGVSTSLVGSAIVPRSAAAGPPSGPDEWFDPSQHGFGFRNWSTNGGTVEQSVGAIEEDTIREVILEDWGEPMRESVGLSIENLPEVLISLISRQIYTSANQLSGTNGHCYGIVFAAQRYYEEPDAIPLDRNAASEFTHPAEPLDDPTVHPVLDEIEWFHIRQFVDFYGWVGRRALFHPQWINYHSQLADIRATVDNYGTAGVSILNSADQILHQVLVYDYQEEGSVTTLFVYDPNRRADRYAQEGGLLTIEIDTGSDPPRMRPYGRGYDVLVFNRYDRIIRARAEGRAPEGTLATSEAELQDHLFSIALFLAASSAVSMVVVGPDGETVSRDRSAFMDTDRSAYQDMRYRYGAEPGVYRVVVVGDNHDDYEIQALAATATESILEDTVTGSISPGEVHQYEVTIPDTPGEPGHIERVRGADGGVDPRVAAGAGAAGTVAALGAYRYFADRGSDESV